jgi:hypothetical protein
MPPYQGGGYLTMGGTEVNPFVESQTTLKMGSMLGHTALFS